MKDLEIQLGEQASASATPYPGQQAASSTINTSFSDMGSIDVGRQFLSNFQSQPAPSCPNKRKTPQDSFTGTHSSHSSTCSSESMNDHHRLDHDSGFSSSSGVSPLLPHYTTTYPFESWPPKNCNEVGMSPKSPSSSFTGHWTLPGPAVAPDSPGQNLGFSAAGYGGGVVMLQKNEALQLLAQPLTPTTGVWD